jgi:hypothetical protein
MDGLGSFGKMLMFFGAALFFFGVIVAFGGKLFNLGRLPGDIYYQKGNFTFYFPVVTSIILSIVLTIVLNFLSKR